MIDAWPADDGVRLSPKSVANERDDGEQRFRLLFEHAAVGMCFVGLDGSFLHANRRMCEIVDRTFEELRATTCVELTHPADRPMEKAMTMRMLSGETGAATWEKRYVRKDGEAVWCGLTLTLIRDDRGEPVQFVGVIEDISERRRAAERLAESESLLRIAGQAAHLGGWAIDPSANRCMLSEEVCAIFEIPPDTVADFPAVARYFDDPSRGRLQAAIERSRATCAGFDLELGVVSATGRRKWVRAIGKGERGGERIVGALQDVTERKAAELEMVRMNRALKMLSGCNEVLVRATDEKQLLSDICRLCVEIGGYAMAWVGYARDDERRSIEPAAIAGDAENYFERLDLGWDENLPSGACAAGCTIRSGEVTIVEDLLADERFAAFRGPAVARGFRSVVVLPLRDKEETFGVLGLHASDVRRPPQAELDLLQEMASDLAFGISHLRAQRERERIQDAVLKISAAVSGRGGSEFLERLVTNMAAAVGALGAFVIRPHPTDPQQMRTLLAVRDGERMENVDFDLADSPCADIRDDGVFVVPAQLDDRYPRCAVASVMGAKAVVGWRLCGASDATLATMLVFFGAPLDDVDFTISTLRIFVARAAAELERQVADARIADQASWLDHARDAIVVRDLAGLISFWNKSAERLYGWSEAEAVGTVLGSSLFVEPDLSRDATAAVVERGFWSGEIEKRRKDGSKVWVESRWSLVGDGPSGARSILAIDTDITERIAAEREIEHLAFYDTLTNLPNRLLLVQRLKSRLKGADGYGALLFIDLDNFKALNDTLGHDKGDLLLQRVAERLTSCVRTNDTVARLGGDEFVVMLEGLGPRSDEATAAARRIATDILAASNHAYDLDGFEHVVTPSIGVTLCGPEESAEDVLKRADLAMYQAKSAGRNVVRFFDPQMQADAQARRALEDDIRAALRSDDFDIEYQPQVDDAGNVVGAEALVRWTHARRGAVAPAEFIPVAEDSGLIVPLGRRVLDLACATLVAWAARPHLAALKLSVNVSAREFRHVDFVPRVVETIERCGANPARLVLELTESVLVDDIDVVIAKMASLRELGIGFSLDDFGTGYSSLSYLKRLPLNQLKIDQSFVRDVLVDVNDAVIARTIVALGRSLSLDVIAEGVETGDQRAFLASVGCRSFQGYYFSRPVPLSEFERFVASGGGREPSDLS